MNPQYYVRTAPRHPDRQLAFSAFSIRPAPAELFDVAHVILLAEAVTAGGVTVTASEPAVAPSSHQALVLIRRIMQQERALPVVRRLVEALRQANIHLYNSEQGARIIAGVLVKNTLYLTCVGAMGAYVIRNEKVATLLQADRTREAYLGRTLQLQLDYQMPTAAALFAEAQTPHAYLITDRFLLAPGDSVIFCSSELPLATLKPALIYTQRPERLATYLTQAAMRQTGALPGVIALHWHVNRVGQLAKQLLLVFFIFFCVSAAMQSVAFVNQRLEQWLTLQRQNNPDRPLPPIVYDTAAAPASSGDNAVATPDGRTSVQVNVDVNVDALAPQVNSAVSAQPVAAVVPIVAADILERQPTPTAIQFASASIEQVADAALPALTGLTTSADAVAPLQGNALAVVSSALPSARSFTRDANVLAANATPTLSPLALLPIAATPTNTILPTTTPSATPTQAPTVLQPPNTLLPLTATSAALATATPTLMPTATPPSAATPVLTEPTDEPPAAFAGVGAESVTILAPPEQASSTDLMTFAWQAPTALPAGQAYEVIVWRPGQAPLTDGLGVAPPGQEQNLAIQLHGLYEAGIVQPGSYHWGVLRVTVDPYTRLALLTPERTFFFEGPDQAPKCNPDRETC